MRRTNVLDPIKYYISKELYIALESETLNSKTRSKQKNVTKKPGIYLVCFRLLNKSKKDIIYNYIYYNPIFVDTLLVYFFFRNINSFRLHEWGDIFTVIDRNVIDISCFKQDTYDKHMFMDVADFEKSYYNLDYKSYYVESVKMNLINLINKMNYVTSGVEETANLLSLIIEKSYKPFIEQVLKNFIKDFDEINQDLDEESNISINLANSSLFVLSDIEGFKTKFLEKGYKLNEGPQSWRGQINSMSALLSIFDMEFRNSLYLHNQHHVRNGRVDSKYSLPKSKFSFRNIHMNLGNIRWYSTKRKLNRELLSRKLLNRINKNSFKTDSDIYQQLTIFLQKSPINESTQTKIEEYLLNTSYMTIKDKIDNNNTLNYTLLGDTKIKEYIKESSEMLEDYINNFRNKSFNINTERFNQKAFNKYHLNIIFNELDNNKLIIEIALGHFAKIMSCTDRISNSNSTLQIANEIGDVLVKNYFYILYSKSIISNIKLFSEECLNILESINLETQSNIETLLSNIENKEIYEVKKEVNNFLVLYPNLNTVIDRYNILNYSLSDWKYDNKNLVDLYTSDYTLRNGFGAIVIDWLMECRLIRQELVVLGLKEKKNYLLPTEEITNIILNKDYNIKHLPLRIPMIVKPKLYKKENINGVKKEILGGYMLNDVRVVDPMIIPNWELQKPSLTKDVNVLYNLVNYASSVAFKINKDVLDFITNYGERYDLFLYDIRLKQELRNKRITKSEYEELESYVSKLDLQENILGLARVFSVVKEFYLPVRLDNRGRMNCISQYLNYQSNELAKSLLMFSKGEKMYKNDNLAINYFKAYGANCFGNKLDKKSWGDRCQWIDDNHNDIMNFTDSGIIDKADNKFLFIAFCIEYNKWYKSFNDIESSYFITHLPIQLDATCNGYQHLSLLLYDYNMAKELNLTKSHWDESPKDFYGFIGMELLDLFKNKKKSKKISKEDINCFERLEQLIIFRSTIKKVIMTIPYNVSVLQMIRYLKDHFTNVKDYTKEDNSWTSYELIYQYKEDASIILCYRDIVLIATCLKEVLDLKFPKLKILITYLKTLAKICNSLNLNISWGTSSGLLVNQGYTTSKEIKLRPFTYSKTSFSLQLSTGNLSCSKQVRAFMPNLIHSLDASALALLVDTYFNNVTEITNFYSIHDCFAVTANNVDILIKFLKQTYNKIYTDDKYLRKLNREIINHIKYNYGEESFDEENLVIKVVIDGKDKPIHYPNVNLVLGTELPKTELIRESSYLIN